MCAAVVDHAAAVVVHATAAASDDKSPADHGHVTVDFVAMGPTLDRLRECSRRPTTAAPKGLAFHGLDANPKAD